MSNHIHILFGYDSSQAFQKHLKRGMTEALKNDRLERESKWDESITSFVEEVHEKPDDKVKTRKVEQNEEAYLIRKPVASYNTLF